MAKLSGMTIKGFTLRECVGRGGIAEVYRAEALAGSGEQVAVKIMFAEKMGDAVAMRAFSDEFEILQDLDHPCIPKAIALGSVQGRPAIVMEYFSGPTLYALHAQEKKFDKAAAFYALVRIVSYLHAERLIHNDLKLENVIVRPDGRLGLVDYGNVRRTSGTSVITSMFKRKPKAVFGTPTYLAPELVQGGNPSFRSDVYSLGVCAHILIGGKPPYDQERASGRLRAALASDEPPSLLDRNPKVPRDFADMVDACIAKNRENRPQDAMDLKDMLKKRFARSKASA